MLDDKDENSSTYGGLVTGGLINAWYEGNAHLSLHSSDLKKCMVYDFKVKGVQVRGGRFLLFFIE